MTIPEAQLETWSHQGSIQQSANTYGIIKNALEATRSAYAEKNYQVFLQGSYANDTNIYAESDVDIVIRLDSTFYRDLSRLPEDQQEAYKKAYRSAEYPYSDFKNDVLSQLNNKFPTSILPGNKATKIEAGGSRRNADVLIAAQFRRYHSFISLGNERYHEGVCFFDASDTRIENFPKQHSQNCTTKHQATNSRFKKVVRIFKNMRSKLIDEGMIGRTTAPSYFIEGLLYNVPNSAFVSNYSDCVANCLVWLLETDKDDLVCANELFYLLREGSPNSWNPQNCDDFLNAAVELFSQ